LNTAHFELNYEKSSRIVEGVAKDEEIRQLKFRIAVMEDEVEDLNEQLAKEEERADLMLQDLEDATAKADNLDGEAQDLLNELRIKNRELDTARASYVL
jgi:chromosome segregation ATPase